MSYVDAGIFENLVHAALGYRVCVVGRDEQSATDTFRRYVTALDNFNLDKTLWAAHGSNGNHKIQFNNGGYVHFVSHGSPQYKGTSVRTAVVDEWGDPIDGPAPNHYTNGNIECIDAIRAALSPDEFRGFCKGNVLKYIWREQYKGGDVDVKKARAYIGYLLEGGQDGAED